MKVSSSPAKECSPEPATVPISDISDADSSSQKTESGEGTCDMTDEDSLVSIHNSFFWDNSGEQLISVSIAQIKEQDTSEHKIKLGNINSDLDGENTNKKLDHNSTYPQLSGLKVKDDHVEIKVKSIITWPHLK